MVFHGKVSDRGRIVVPAQLRRSLGLEPGEDIVLREHNGELHVVSLKQAVRQIQDRAQQCIPADVNLVDDLLEMRRAEVQQDTSESTVN